MATAAVAVATVDPAARERLILEYLPKVKLMARSIRRSRHLPPSVTLADMISDGTLGLVKAIDKFDPSRGWKLGTYAEHRIRGEILDGLRRAKWGTRRDTFVMLSLTDLGRAQVPTVGGEERRRLLRVAVDALPARERLITRAWAYGGLRVVEIARALGLTEGRVSQVLTRATERMRGK